MATSSTARNEVSLTAGESGSVLLRGALAAACTAFPEVYSDFSLPGVSAFRRNYGEIVVQFEARRLASEARVGIARVLAGHLASHLEWGGEVPVPLVEHLRSAAGPVSLMCAREGAEDGVGVLLEVPWRGERFRGAGGLRRLADALLAEALLAPAAHRALHGVAERLVDDRLDLRGERFALMGAGAELAPTELFVRAGAEVLWLDRAAFEASAVARALGGDAGGAVWVPSQGPSDLLGAPAQALGAMREFAAKGPIHLGLLAYAPGGGRELRLAGAMTALAEAMEPGSVRSVACFVSPTTPGALAAEEAAGIGRRQATSPGWMKALARVGVLRADPVVSYRGEAVSRTTVGLQGATYLAAQMLAKIAWAEGVAVDGLGGVPVRVSANVAGITRTRSLEHPLFQAAFIGAGRFGIEIFEPATTRALAGLLWLHDVLWSEGPRVEASEAERGSWVGARALHGGARTLPWRFEPTIRVGAALGLLKEPKLLLKLKPERRKKRK